MLAEYDIRPAKSRYPDGRQLRGFARADFADAWSRYCPTELDQAAAGTVVDPDPSQPSHRNFPAQRGTVPRPGTGQPVPRTQPVPL